MLFGDSPRLDWFATLRSRFGVSVTPDALVYVTGGAALTEVTTAGTIFGFSASVDANGNPIALPANTVFGHHARRTGWTAGGGFEAHLGGNWTGKVEYPLSRLRNDHELHVQLPQFDAAGAVASELASLTTPRARA